MYKNIIYIFQTNVYTKITVFTQWAVNGLTDVKHVSVKIQPPMLTSVQKGDFLFFPQKSHLRNFYFENETVFWKSWLLFVSANVLTIQFAVYELTFFGGIVKIKLLTKMPLVWPVKKKNHQIFATVKIKQHTVCDSQTYC